MVDLKLEHTTQESRQQMSCFLSMKNSGLCSLTEESNRQKKFFKLQFYHSGYSKFIITTVSIIFADFLITKTSPRKKGRLSVDTQKYLFEKRMPTQRLHQLNRLNT